MNDISAILAKIGADAKQFEESTVAAAETGAKAIEENYLQQGREEAARVLEAARRQAEAIHQRALSQSGIESRNSRLRVRREAIETAFRKAMEQLCAMPGEKKTAFYAELAAGCLAGDAKLVLNAADRAAIGRETAKAMEERCKAAGRTCKVSLSEETGSFRGGFILDQGSTETNCTFEVLSMGVKEELEAEVASALFG